MSLPSRRAIWNRVRSSARRVSAKRAPISGNFGSDFLSTKRSAATLLRSLTGARVAPAASSLGDMGERVPSSKREVTYAAAARSLNGLSACATNRETGMPRRNSARANLFWRAREELRRSSSIARSAFISSKVPVRLWHLPSLKQEAPGK